MSASIALPQGIVQTILQPWIGRAARSPQRWERSLGRKDVFTLEAADRVTVSCLDGMLWITLDGDGSDYVLATGQALRVPAGNRAVIEALAESRFGVAPA